MYGQTGSGKTYTMAGIEEYASALLLPSSDLGGRAADGVLGHLTFFEIAGGKCLDLLSEVRGRELQLKQDADGRTGPVGAEVAEISSGKQLLHLIASAKQRRATHSTGANAESSRSHAVCQLTLATPAAAPAPLIDAPSKGRQRSRDYRPPMLTLVDCAGGLPLQHPRALVLTTVKGHTRNHTPRPTTLNHGTAEPLHL